MLGFFRFGTFCATLAGGFALLGVFGGCGGGGVSCSTDNHSVIDSSGNKTACAATQACAVSGGSSGCSTCDPTQCLKNNSCIQGWQNYDDAVGGNMANQTTECRLQCAQPSDCPFNYHCFSPGAGAQAYCVNDRTPYKPAGMGEAAAGAPWGVPCSPTHGNPDPFAANSDCDSAHNFWCYGISPTDANSFCTQYQCNNDGDCPGGWWCATINDSPNVANSHRGQNIGSTYNWGSVTTVCLPRAYNGTPGTYCAPCKSDVDCPTNNGGKQHCTAADGMSSKETICAVECTADANCPLDYHCGMSNGNMVCLPRAATCLGTGQGKPNMNQFCDPCHSDADCGAGTMGIMGFCTLADYSTEHFCTASTPTCTCPSGMACMDSCPMVPTAALPPNTTTDGEACTVDTSTGLPAKQCYAGGEFGLGCYTYHCAATSGTCVKNSDCCSGKCDTAGQACL